jgi:hypothetical protein
VNLRELDRAFVQECDSKRVKLTVGAGTKL